MEKKNSKEKYFATRIYIIELFDRSPFTRTDNFCVQRLSGKFL